MENLVLESCGIEKEEMCSDRRRSRVSKARSVFCYLCVREPGESVTSMAKRLGLSQPAVGYAVDRGKRAAKARDIKLKD